MESDHSGDGDGAGDVDVAPTANDVADVADVADAGSGSNSGSNSGDNGDAQLPHPDAAFVRLGDDHTSRGARVGRLHRDFLHARFKVLAGDSPAMDGRSARALYAYALGRMPTDEEFAPYAALVREVGKVDFADWFAIYRSTAQLDARLAAALPAFDGQPMRQHIAEQVPTPQAPKLSLPSDSMAPGPRSDIRQVLTVKQALVHRYTRGLSGLFSRWKKRFLEIDFTHESVQVFNNDKKTGSPVKLLFRDIVSCKPDPSNRRPHVLAVETAGEEHPTLFAAESDSERDIWVKSILTHALVHAVVTNMGRDRVASLVQLGADVNTSKNDKIQHPPLLLALKTNQMDVAKCVPRCVPRFGFPISAHDQCVCVGVRVPGHSRCGVHARIGLCVCVCVCVRSVPCDTHTGSFFVRQMRMVPVCGGGTLIAMIVSLARRTW